MMLLLMTVKLLLRHVYTKHKADFKVDALKHLKKNNLFNLRSKDTRIDHILVSFLIKNKSMKIY